MAKRSSGSFLDNLSVPQIGDSVWFLEGQVNQKPCKGVVCLVEQTFYGSEYSLHISSADGRKCSATTAYTFDHKPKKVEVADAYGVVKVWK